MINFRIQLFLALIGSFAVGALSMWLHLGRSESQRYYLHRHGSLIIIHDSKTGTLFERLGENSIVVRELSGRTYHRWTWQEPWKSYQ